MFLGAVESLLNWMVKRLSAGPALGICSTTTTSPALIAIALLIDSSDAVVSVAATVGVRLPAGASDTARRPRKDSELVGLSTPVASELVGAAPVSEPVGALPVEGASELVGALAPVAEPLSMPNTDTCARTPPSGGEGGSQWLAEGSRLAPEQAPPQSEGATLAADSRRRCCRG